MNDEMDSLAKNNKWVLIELQKKSSVEQIGVQNQR